MTDVMSKKSLVDSNMSISVQSPSELTEGQKACLRLVGQHYTSKEIARKLGISPFTVDQRLDAARRKLNTSSRKDAAKMFAQLELHAVSQPLVYEPHPVESNDIAANHNTAAGQVISDFARRSLFFSVSPQGERRNALSTREIAVRAIIIAFYGSLVMAFFVAVLTATFRLFQ